MSTATQTTSGSLMAQSLLKAIENFSPVRSTMGPGGKTVILAQGFGEPVITKDGIKVAEAISSSDALVKSFEDLMKSSIRKTNDIAGDGTTSCCELLCEMLNLLLKYRTPFRSLRKMGYGISKGLEAVLKELESMARKISSPQEIANVASISSNGDREIGQILAEAMEKVKREGVITVEQGKGRDKFILEVKEGMSFDRGYLSPYFVSNQEKMLVVLDNPFILIANKKLSSIHPFVPILEKIVKQDRSLLVIAEDVEGEMLTALLLNKLRGGLKVAAVKAPGFGDRRGAMLEDLRILTNAEHVISDDLPINLKDLELNDLGTARTVTITKDETTIVVEGKGNEEAIRSRCQQLKNQIEEATSDYDKEKIRERLAKLTSGVAVIKVGGGSEAEVSERKDRLEDALNATKAAIEEGIVPGGGAALLYAQQALKNFRVEDEDEQEGVKIVLQSLEAPIRRILSNAGREPAVIINNLRFGLKKVQRNSSGIKYNASKEENRGYESDESGYESDDIDNNLHLDERRTMTYDASKESESDKCYVNAFEAGIVDPLKVVRTALENAASIAGVLTSTDGLITKLPKKEEESEGAGAGMSGMGGMGGMGGF